MPKTIGPILSLLTVVMLVSGSTILAERVRCNQLGFHTEAQKIAVATTAIADTFYLYKAEGGEPVYSGTLSPARLWTASNEQARLADFSSFKIAGSYVIKCAGCEDSHPFIIGNTPHLELTKGAIKSFYFNRCSFALTQEFAGVYARNAGHPDTSVEIHNSAASTARPSGSKINSPGGWYDAGDYGKYIVNSGISTYTMFAAYEAFPAFYDTLKLDLPESSNRLPDLLDEALFNFRWMLTMQDPEDGGVYHKLTSASFCGMVMPEADKLKRYAVAKSTAATLDFAAVCAQSSRIFRKFETVLPGFADSCLAAAEKAWAWGRANPAVAYKNSNTSSPAISTGDYRDGSPADELQWAATELYIATLRDSFFTIAFPDGQLKNVTRIPSWPNVGTLGLYSLILCKKELPKVTSAQITAAVKLLADSTLLMLNDNPYHLAMSPTDFGWGSNSAAANRGMACIMGYLATQTPVYKNAAIDQLDYLLGRNPLSISYVTGYGDSTPMFIHHRPSEADTVKQPIPGFLAGGPNPALQDTADCGGNYYKSILPAKAYLDSVCSYASNEIAINWNAPLVFLAGAVQALGTTIPAGNLKKVPLRSQKSTMSIRQQQGKLQVLPPSGSPVIVTIETLTGRVLLKSTISGSTTLTTPWPLQMVIVSAAPISDHSHPSIFTGMLPSGHR